MDKYSMMRSVSVSLKCALAFLSDRLARDEVETWLIVD